VELSKKNDACDKSDDDIAAESDSEASEEGDNLKSSFINSHRPRDESPNSKKARQNFQLTSC
jgi:hypothetical protein